MTPYLAILMLLGSPAMGGSDTANAAAAPAPIRPSGPPPSVKIECTPDPVRMGDTVTCVLTIVHRQDVSITVGAPANVSPQPTVPSQPHGNGLLKTTRVLTLQNLAMQKLKIEGLTVNWTEASGGQDRLAVPVQRIPVQSVLEQNTNPEFKTFAKPQGDEDTFWANHGPVPYRVTHWPTVIAVGVLLVVLLGIVVGVVIKRWLDARKVVPIDPVDPRPAHVIAQSELAKLIAEDLPGQDRTDEYYVRLSEIIRAYLERRFQTNALEMTSDEIRAWARTSNFSSEILAGVDDFLEETDLVKFADFAPSASQLDTVTRVARGLIFLTQDRDESDQRDPDDHDSQDDQDDKEDQDDQGGDKDENEPKSPREHIEVTA